MTDASCGPAVADGSCFVQSAVWAAADRITHRLSVELPANNSLSFPLFINTSVYSVTQLVHFMVFPVMTGAGVSNSV